MKIDIPEHFIKHETLFLCTTVYWCVLCFIVRSHLNRQSLHSASVVKA
jgi:hypothetical protein